MKNLTLQPHYSTATDARVLQTREALRQAFLSLLDKRPLDQISVREISAASGVGYTTFYRHFPGKDELLDDIASKEVASLISKAFEVFSAADPRSAAHSLCQHIFSHQALWKTLLTGGAANAVREEFINQALGIAQHWDAAHDWIPTEMGVTIAASSTIELLGAWLKQDEPLSVDQVAVIFEHVVIKPIISVPKP